VAVLQTQGLTGIASGELTGGRRSSPPLQARAGEAYPVIKSAPSLITRLETSIPALLANIDRVSNNLNALMDEDNRLALKRTLADLEVLSRTLAARSATIDSGLTNASHAMQNTARFTDQLPQLVQRVEHSADAFDRMANELAGAGANATGTLEATRVDVQRFTSETLPEVHELVAELRGLTATLQHVGDEVKRNPRILIYGKPLAKRGPGE
jgi:phospholipid/cholesterol/gamma-HCH transport system substrate-binding protein